MLRVFTKDIGRWKKGTSMEYPLSTWKSIEQSAGMRLDKFSKPMDEIVKQLESVDNEETVGIRRKNK